MRGLPTYCARCGHVFEAPGISLKNSRNVTFIGMRTNCPKCGGVALVGDGTYSAKGHNISLDDGPPLTRAIIAQLNVILERAKKEGPDVHDFLAEVAEVSPEFSQALRKYDRYGLSLLILLMVFVLRSCDVSVNVDFNKLVDQAWHIHQGQDPNSHELPIPAEPAPLAPGDARLFLTSGSPPEIQGNRHQRRQAQAQSRRRAKRPSPQ